MAEHPRYNIAVIFPDWYSFLLKTIEGILEIRGIRHHCNFRNFIHPDISVPVEFPQGYRPDGILASFDNDDFDPAWLKDLDLPVVNIFTCQKNDHPSVGVRPESIATLVCDHFVALDFQEIGLLETEGNADTRSMQRCIKAECDQRNIPFWSVPVPEGIPAGAWPQFEAGAPGLKEKLVNRDRRIGVYTMHDMRGRLLADYCTELGVRVPDDVGILGRFDSINSRLCTPELSSIVMPAKLIAEKSIQLLVNLIEGNPVEHTHIVVDATEIRVRESTVGASNSDMIVLQARALIRENACRGLTVDELIQSLPLARSTFEKRYRALTGSSPAQDIRQFRAEKARRLLLTTEMTVEQIATAVGFADSRPFVVFFKREVGVTPGEFRKENDTH